MHRIERTPCNEYEVFSQQAEQVNARDYEESLNVTRGLLLGILLSAPIWAALIVFGANLVRAIEHFDRWGWILSSPVTYSDVMVVGIFCGILSLVIAAVLEGRKKS